MPCSLTAVRAASLPGRVLACFPEDSVHPYTMERFEEPGFGSIQRPARDFYGPLFQANQALIFISSVGLAVREIAPHLRSKATDPAVIVLDELGQFVIPRAVRPHRRSQRYGEENRRKPWFRPRHYHCHGHNGRFSVDAWATKQGCAISSLSAVKAVSAAVLEGDVPLCTPLPHRYGPAEGAVPGRFRESGHPAGLEKSVAL